MQQFLNLLLKFQSLPRTRRAKTFMEISGYPHYENVCSNILAFYFDPSEEHGMGDLLLRAFLKMAGESESEKWQEFEIPNRINVHREYGAEDQKRIDLVLEGDNFTIGIENKIYHWEANDLENYARVLDRLGAGKTTIKAILCLKTQANNEAPGGGFIRYTYPVFWDHVKDLLGHSIQPAPYKWLTYLTEFMNATNDLAGEDPDEKEVTDFFAKHHALIEELVKDRDRLLKKISTRIRNIHDAIEAIPETKIRLKTRLIWQSFTVASHFEIQGQTIGLDLRGSLEGWQIDLFHHGKGGNTGILQNLVDSPSMRQRFPGIQFQRAMTLQKWHTNTNDLKLEESLLSAIKALNDAADLLENNTAQKDR